MDLELGSGSQTSDRTSQALIRPKRADLKPQLCRGSDPVCL